jgi:hypothetical protein
LGLSCAQAQTLLNSWEDSQEGWTILETNWTSDGFSTNTGVTAGIYSWELTAATNPNYGPTLQGPSSTALTALMADAGQVTLDVLAPTAGSFGYYQQWDLVVNQPGGLGSVSSDGSTYSQSPAIGGPESHLIFTIPATIRTALAANPALPTYLSFSIGGGGGGTIYIDNLRVWEVPTYTESWENTEDGWTILQTNWTSEGFSTNTGVTAGSYSWELTAATSPNYGAALQSPSSTSLTAAMSSPGSIDLDVLVPKAGSFGYYLQWDLVVDQPGGLGSVSSDGFTYSQSPAIGGPESHLQFTIPSTITTALAANPTLPTSLIFQIGGGGGGTIYIDNLRYTPNAAPTIGPAKLWIRETFDDHGTSEVYPAVTPYYNDVSSVGFDAAEPWIVNPAASAQTNDLLMAIRGYPDFPFPVGPYTMGLPSSLDGHSGALVEDNSFDGKAGGTLWTDGDFMTRTLAPNNFINFTVEGEYWFAMTIGQVFDAQYAGDIPASGAGGIGFADGDDTNADFVAIGVTGTNVYLGPADASDPYGTTNVTKSVYISQGTLGQPGDPNSLIYNPINDPMWGTNYTLTNFTGGPYYVSAYGTNAYGASRLGVVQGDGIVVLGHLRTHTNGVATMDAKTYLAALGDQMDLATNGFIETNIQWDCSYSFNFSGTMTRMLAFENGEFPFYIYAFRASTNLANVLGIDPGFISVSPLADTFVGFPINMTNFAAEASTDSSTVLSGNTAYGTLNYQWYQNGVAISNATLQYLNIPSAATNDPSLPAGTDAGTYTCVATDPSGIWGSVTTAPVVVTVTLEPPLEITAVRLSANQSTINVTFNEPGLTGDTILENYTLSDGVTVTNAVELPAVGETTTVQLQTTLQPIGTKLTLTVNNITNEAGGVLAKNTTETFWTDIPGTGSVDIDYWLYPAEDTQAYFNTFLPATPNPQILASYTENNWDGPTSGINVNSGSYFGDRMYGWFIPPVGTNYVFYIACDDGGRLSLSTNADSANLCVIAAESLWTTEQDWTNYSYEFPTGDHRGDGTSTTFNAAGTMGWDTSVASESPATACQQNRSDQFIVAYYDSLGSGGPPGADDYANWASSALSQVTDVVLPGSRFWPNVDTNGQALISLKAGQMYYMQLEHCQQTGGYGGGVTYKYAGAPDPVSPSPTILTGANIASLVSFTPSLSISQSNGLPVITYYGVLLSGTNVNNIITPVGTSSGGPGQYIPPAGQSAEFFRTSE